MKPVGYRSPRKKPRKKSPVTWTLRLAEPHTIFLRECYEADGTLSGELRDFLTGAPPRPGRPRVIEGFPSHHSIRLNLEDWRRVEGLAKAGKCLPAEAVRHEIERRAKQLGYELITKKRNATW